MIVATWNVNSLKIRLLQVKDFLIKNNVDILCLQEIKLSNDKFPKEFFDNLGYYSYYNGQKTYNGVAILSRHFCFDVSNQIIDFNDSQKRFLAVTVNIKNKKLRIINVYCPNGQDIDTDKYKYKLEWFSKFKYHLIQELNIHKYLIVAGDYNIAPDDDDVHSPNIWIDKILVSKEERKAFYDLLDIGLCDSSSLFRKAEKSFTWWDYRYKSFEKNLGFRIDHILISKNIINNCIDFFIDKNLRKNERPSDHVPVLMNIEI